MQNKDAPVSTDKKVLLDELHNHLQEAKISRKEHNLIEVVRGDKDEAHPLLPISIYLENLRSVHNIASIMRTTEAFSLGKIFVSGSIYPEHEKLKKASMGTHDWVLCTHVESFKALKRPLVVVETVPTSVPYYDFTYPEECSLAFGNEEYGCSDALLQAADHIIHIPLFGRKNSLNVSSAFSIIAADLKIKNSVKEK